MRSSVCMNVLWISAAVPMLTVVWLLSSKAAKPDAVRTNLDVVQTNLDAVRTILDVVQTNLDAVQTNLDVADDLDRFARYIYIYPQSPPLLYCSQCERNAGYRMEALIINRLLKSRFRCSSPEKARWLLFPVGYTCRIACTVSRTTPYNVTLANAATAVASRLKPLFKTALWQERSRDHVFIFAHDKGGGWIGRHEPIAFNEMRKGLFITTVSTFMPGNPQSYIRGWDIGIPSCQRMGALDVLDVPPLDAQELLSRKVIAFWAGGVRPLHATRAQMVAAFANHSRIQLWNRTGTFFSREYFFKMNHAMMCLYLGGHTPQRWSGTLGAVLQSRCLPLLVNDFADPPFGDVLPWDSFSVSLTEKEMIEEGDQRLEAVVRDKQRVAQLVAAYNVHRRRLLFFDPPRNGDALTTLVESLKRRETQFRAPSRGHDEERHACRSMLRSLKDISPHTDARHLTPAEYETCKWGTMPEAWSP